MNDFRLPPTARASAPDARATPIQDTALYAAALAEIKRLEDELKREKALCEKAILECVRLTVENSQLRDET